MPDFFKNVNFEQMESRYLTCTSGMELFTDSAFTAGLDLSQLTTCHRLADRYSSRSLRVEISKKTWQLVLLKLVLCN